MGPEIYDREQILREMAEIYDSFEPRRKWKTMKTPLVFQYRNLIPHGIQIISIRCSIITKVLIKDPVTLRIK